MKQNPIAVIKIDEKYKLSIGVQVTDQDHFPVISIPSILSCCHALWKGFQINLANLPE